MSKNNLLPSFLTGTLILTVSGIVVKVIGSLNWIILSRVLGGEGIGLYQMGFPIYLLALSISSAGIPVAISIITAEKLAKDDYIGAKKVFHTSLYFLFLTGLIFSLGLVFGAQALVSWGLIRDARAYYSIIALAPAVFFVTFLSSFRGYLQGWQTMTPTAVSEICEQLLRVITMIAMANALLPYGLEYAAAGASLGAGVGAIGGLIVLMFFYARMKKEIALKVQQQTNLTSTDSARQIISRLLKLALPVSMSSLMLPLVANMDLLIVPARLEVAGFSVSQATELFGYLTGMAVPLVNLSTILTASLAISLVPSIAKLAALNAKEAINKQVNTAFNVAALITIPCSVGLFVLAEPISSLIYNAPLATPTIQVMSFGIFILGVHQVSTGILQGLGHTSIPMFNMILAALLKVLLNYQLTAIPILGIKGAALATVVDIGFAALLNLFFIYKYTNFAPNIWQLSKLSLASLLMGLAVYGVLVLKISAYAGLNLLLAIVLAVPVYALCTLLLGAIDRDSLQKLPVLGPRLITLFQRFL